MTKSGRVLAAVGGVVAIYRFGQQAFVPPALRRTGSLAAPAVAAVASSAPAFADEIGDAAKKLSDAAYPFLKEVNWNSYTYLLKPGSSSAGDWAKAIDKAIVMGASMDPELLKKGVMAHHKAIGGLRPNNLVLSKSEFEGVNAAIGRMIASVPESQTMDVYDAFSNVVSGDVPSYLMSTVNEADAKKAYSALMEFKDVVKANPITPKEVSTPEAISSKLGDIDAAASKLSSASYPFIQDIDWTSNLASTPLPGTAPIDVMNAIDSMLVMGASMDGKLLKEAAEAHHRALSNMDSKLVASASDYEAINAALGKAIASVPTSKVMGVYNAMGKIVNPVVSSKLFSTVNPQDAQAAYTAFLEFKDVVKAAR